MRAYLRVVRASVRHKFVTLLLGLALFSASIASTRLLPAGFLPKEDHARAQFAVELPPGARLVDTKAVTDDLVRRIAALPEVVSVFVDGGRQIPSKREIRVASLTVTLVPKSTRGPLPGRDRDGDRRDPARSARHALLVDPRQRPTRPSRSSSAAATGAGDRHGGQAARRDGRAPASRQRHLHRAGRPHRDPRRAALRHRRRPWRVDRGRSPRRCASARSATSARTSPSSHRRRAADPDPRPSCPEAVRGELDVLRDLRVPVGGGAAVPLATSPTSGWVAGPTSIDRYDPRGAASPSRPTCRDPTRWATCSARRWRCPAARHLPEGVTLSQVGDAEIMNEVFSGFALAMGDRPDDGAGRSRAALRQRRPAPDDPVLSCRCRSAAPSSGCSSSTGRSRCRW